MEYLTIILGIVIAINIILGVVTSNFAAFCGWAVALIEYTRRFTA